MSKSLLLSAGFLFGVSICLTAGAPRAAAQGPAGAGAAAAAAQDRSHSLNPMHWMKKDSKDSTDALGGRSAAEKKLTRILRSEGVLDANTTATQACANFADLEGCLAALHATHDLGLNFVCVRASVSGVHTSTDLSGCKDVDKDKPQSLKQVIHLLKPDANAKKAAKNAELESKADLEKIGGSLLTVSD